MIGVVKIFLLFQVKKLYLNFLICLCLVTLTLERSSDIFCLKYNKIIVFFGCFNNVKSNEIK